MEPEVYDAAETMLNDYMVYLIQRIARINGNITPRTSSSSSTS